MLLHPCSQSSNTRLMRRVKVSLPNASTSARLRLSEPSRALSILLISPTKFEGRKVGALVTDGVNSDLITALKKALDKESATVEFIAPTIAGVRASDGSWIEANQTIDGGPSVLYYAVALMISGEGSSLLANQPALAILLPMRSHIQSS